MQKSSEGCESTARALFCSCLAKAPSCAGLWQLSAASTAQSKGEGTASVAFFSLQRSGEKEHFPWLP